MDSAQTSIESAERHLRQGEPLAAYNVAQEALERAPGNARLRQLQALALARSGDVERANAILAALSREGAQDSETLGMLARTHKDLGLRSEGEARARHLQSAFDIYRHAYLGAIERRNADAAGYTGINAAALAVLRGDLAASRSIASEVQALAASDGYWREAILGEAALILGDSGRAREHYARAVSIAGPRFGDVASTRRQARLLESALATADPPSRALSIPPVIAYSGHMIDRPDRGAARFPPEREAHVRRAIGDRIAAMRPAAFYGSAACGADLLFLEAAREVGAETHVVLPFPADAFRAESVDYAGKAWSERFDQALALADSVTIASDHRAHGSNAPFEYANLLLTGMARLRAQVLDTDVLAIAVRQPRAAVVPGGTVSLVALWERAGMRVESIDPGTAAEAATPPAAAARPDAIRHEMRALLFADAVGYSKLTEDQIPVYISEFLGAIAAMACSSPNRFEHVETAGDGIYMVFADAGAAGRFALELSALATGTDWAARGLPAGFNLRVALHCGPVHCGIDPLTGLPIYTGPHTSRAARIEPITPPGQVYASSAYAAVVAATGEDLALTYVGRIPLAKGYGTLGLYHVRRER